MEKIKPGDIVDWKPGDPDAHRYDPGPYVVKQDYNDICITLVHLDGSSVRYRPEHYPTNSPKDHIHRGLQRDKFRLDVFLDAAKKAHSNE